MYKNVVILTHIAYKLVPLLYIKTEKLNLKNSITFNIRQSSLSYPAGPLKSMKLLDHSRIANTQRERPQSIISGEVGRSKGVSGRVHNYATRTSKRYPHATPGKIPSSSSYSPGEFSTDTVQIEEGS